MPEPMNHPERSAEGSAPTGAEPLDPSSHDPAGDDAVTVSRIRRDTVRIITDAVHHSSDEAPSSDEAEQLAPEESDDAEHECDDRFIPISTDALIAELAAEAGRRGHEADSFARLCKLFRTIIEQEADAFRRLLERLYDPLNPDRDLSYPAIDPAAQSSEARLLFAAHVRYLLEKANYRRLEPVDLQRTLKVANTQRLRVKLREDMVEDLDLWVRGLGTTTRRIRTRRAIIRGQTIEIPVYRRLVVIARLRDDPMLYMKMYRNIPTADLEALLPHASAAMTPLDKLKIIGGAGAALGGISTAAISSSNMLTVIGALGVPFGIMSWRAFSGYKRARMERDRQLTRNLFFMNLASNYAVLQLLIARTAEEETKEAILAYAAGLLAEPDGFASERDLDIWCERMIRERFAVDTNFDAPDAIETIDRFDLWADRARFRVHPIDRAIDIAERHWSGRRSWDYHERTILARGLNA